MRPGDTIAIEFQVVDIDSDGRVQVHNSILNKSMDKLTWIDPDIIRRSEKEIRKEAMEQMYEVIKYLVKSRNDGGADIDDFISIFGCTIPGNDEFSEYTADGFYNKVSEYMAIHSFNVGDLVYTHDDVDEPGVITRIDNSGWLSVLWYDGSCGDHEYQNLKKYTNTKKFNKIFELLSEMMQEVKK